MSVYWIKILTDCWYCRLIDRSTILCLSFFSSFGFLSQSKLESYRDNEKVGKELSADQKVAVSKYNEVAMTLEFAREFSKQIAQIVSVSEKDLKKKQKKDEASKRQGETSKIREVLIIQDVIKHLSDGSVRKDFLEGTNGACKLEESDFEVLDVL